MYPMSLYESGESNGKISIQELFNNCNIDIDGISSDCTVPELVFATCRGGWPGTFKARTDNARLKTALSYFKAVCDEDISRIDGVKTNTKVLRKKHLYICKEVKHDCRCCRSDGNS